MTEFRGIRVGVAGTGFVSRHFVMHVERDDDLTISHVLTRRRITAAHDFPRPELLTNSANKVLDHSDVLFECSGDVRYAAEIIDHALSRGLPVVTMNAEFHVTAGSYFVSKGLLSEAEGDQPGCQAALCEEAITLGFKPLVFGNIKGFLNQDPAPEVMAYWSSRQGISLPMTTSFTDGTKLQIEQALVANGLGGDIATPGLIGPAVDDLMDGGRILGERAKACGCAISDYVLSAHLPHGVFIVGEHDQRQQKSLRYLKLGDGPFYVLLKNNIFVHLEVPKTIKRLVRDQNPLLDNSELPRISVAAIAKHELRPDTRIRSGIGSFLVRGSTVRIAEAVGHVPIGLMSDAVVTRRVSAGEVVTFDDVELPDSLARQAWLHVEQRVSHKQAQVAVGT